MRIETPKERIERKCRSAVYLAEAHERAMAEARRQEDGFIKICDQNHMEAMERDTIVTVIQTTPPEISTQCAAQQDADDGEFMCGIVNGMLMGSAAMGLVVVLLKAAGVM